MELEKICITGINSTYAISNVKKSFEKLLTSYGKKYHLGKDTSRS
ncbi:MAG: hypothetical protein ACLSW1_01060 [Lachnospira sp.]